MTHRIFYGIDFKLTDYDKKMFSRKGYECKDLLQGRGRIACGGISETGYGFSNMESAVWIFVSGVPYL